MDMHSKKDRVHQKDEIMRVGRVRVKVVLTHCPLVACNESTRNSFSLPLHYDCLCYLVFLASVHLHVQVRCSIK